LYEVNSGTGTTKLKKVATDSNSSDVFCDAGSVVTEGDHVELIREEDSSGFSWVAVPQSAMEGYIETTKLAYFGPSPKASAAGALAKTTTMFSKPKTWTTDGERDDVLVDVKPNTQEWKIVEKNMAS
jgi:hypothetical protein